MADEFVTWSDDFLVGNTMIDSQHKELVRMINEFYAGCQMGGILARVHFLKTIQGAMQYIKTHFSTEEEIMIKVGYSGYEVHKKQHDDFVANVTSQINILENDANPDPAGFVKFLMDWVLNHVAKSDKEYAPSIAMLEQ